MWAHYAQSNKGFVIEFDGKHEFFNQSRDSDELYGHLHSIIYSEQRPSCNSLIEEPLMADVFFVKSERWKDESEWRMLQPLEHRSRLKEEEDIVLDNHGQPIYLFPIPSSCITGIIFGSRMSKTDSSEIRRILSADYYSHVKRYQSVLDDKKFELKIVPEGDRGAQVD